MAWSSMARERLDDRGMSAALLSSIGDEELCDVCLFVREESRKQSESGTLKESVGIAKLLLMADDCELSAAERVVVSYACILRMETKPLVGRSEEVAKPPPRIGV